MTYQVDKIKKLLIYYIISQMFKKYIVVNTLDQRHLICQLDLLNIFKCYIIYYF